MPIKVKVVEMVAVWLVSGENGLPDLGKAFQETGIVREKYPGKGRLFLVWPGAVPGPIRAELSKMHGQTSEIFERIVCYGASHTLAALNARAMLSGKYGVGLEGTTVLKTALEYLSKDLPLTTQLALNRLERDIRAIVPQDFPTSAGHA